MTEPEPAAPPPEPLDLADDDFIAPAASHQAAVDPSFGSDDGADDVADEVDRPEDDEAVDDDDTPRDVRLPRAATNDMQYLAQIHELGHRNLRQRILYAVVARMLTTYRGGVLELFVGLGLMLPFALLVGMAMGFGLAAGLDVALSRIGLEHISIVLIALLAVFSARVLKELAEEHAVEAAFHDGLLDNLTLGRIEELFNNVSPAVHGWFFGAFFGIQHALLMFTPDHFGLPIEGGLSECFLLTLDNACYGLFLDTFEMYDLYWGEPLEHSWYSASVFFAFRLTFEGLAVLIGYSLYKRYRMRHLFRSVPRDERNVRGMLKWIGDRLSDKDHWPNRYHDEFMFLLLCRAYINGDYEYVRRLTRDLPAMRVDESARQLFVSPDGERLFPPAGSPDEGVR